MINRVRTRAFYLFLLAAILSGSPLLPSAQELPDSIKATVPVEKVPLEKIAIPAQPAPSHDNRKNQEGRVYFMAMTGLRTLTLYPAGYATLMGNSDADSRTITGLSLLTFGASLYGSYRFTQNRDLGYGRVAMMLYGGELAASYAFLMSRFLDGAIGFKPKEIVQSTYQEYDMNGPTGVTHTVNDTVESEIPDKIFALSRMFGFPLGVYAGSRCQLAGNDQYGNVTIMRFFGRSAWLYGHLLPLYSSGDDYDSYKVASGALTMAFIPGSLYMGYRLVSGMDYSSGRGYFIETTGIMGGVTGLLLPMLVDIETDDVTNRRILISSVMAFHAMGTFLGFQYKPEESYTFAQGAFTSFSAVCGAALGLSIPFLAQADAFKPYIVAGLAGGWGGLFAGEKLGQSLFEKSSRDNRSWNADLSLPIAYEWPALLKQPDDADRRIEMPGAHADWVRARVTF